VVLPAGRWRAAAQGDAKAVTTWLDEGGGVDAHCAEQDGETLLMPLVRRQHARRLSVEEAEARAAAGAAELLGKEAADPNPNPNDP